MNARLLSIALALATSQLAAAAGLRPMAVERFFVTPDQPSVLEWSVESGTPPAEIVLSDYAGKEVGRVPLETAGEGRVRATVNLPPGFYEIKLLSEPAGAGQRFGLVSIAAHEGEKDAFFSIDSAMSWLVRDDSLREQLVKVLARSGVVMSRERVSWGQINPDRGKWDWESSRHYESLRKMYAADGVEMLEMFHDAPGWTGRVGKYPDDLVAAADSWGQIARRWHGTWNALEVWNEPDISFGDYLPADQYVPLVRTLAFALKENRIETPLVGGVVAHFDRRFLDNAAQNGLLDSVAVFSFHTYGRAGGMETLVANYRDWLAAHKHAAMLLWITECGRPWRRGPDRPPLAEDAESALDVTMKAVEARACGIARYFSFVYPFYEERDNNFGLMGRRGTPLRSMAAYVRMASVLAHTRYLGDLQTDDPAIQRARVFGDDRQAIAVLYTGKAGDDATVKIPLSAERIEGIDGRRLEATSDGAIPAPDGMVYVWLDREQVKSYLNSDTPAMRLWTVARQAPPKPEAPSPIVLRYQFDRDVVEPRSDGYHVKKEGLAKTSLAVRVFNLSEEPRNVVVRLTFTGAVAKVLDGAERSLSVPAAGAADTAWQVDLSGAFAADGRVHGVISATDTSSARLATLAIDLAGMATLEDVLGRYPRRVKLPLEELAAWQPAITGAGHMEIDKPADAAWRLTAEFHGGDRWVYPRFTLPEGTDLGRYAGLVFRGRCRKPATVRVFLWEGETGVGYISSTKILPADDQWHTALVKFGDLTLSTANSPDPNHRLDLGDVKRISIGMNSDVDQNVLEVQEAWLVGGP